jgi:hypothetical protein
MPLGRTTKKSKALKESEETELLLTAIDATTELPKKCGKKPKKQVE